jgi:hypothetical protein
MRLFIILVALHFSSANIPFSFDFFHAWRRLYLFIDRFVRCPDGAVGGCIRWVVVAENGVRVMFDFLRRACIVLQYLHSVSPFIIISWCMHVL